MIYPIAYREWPLSDRDVLTPERHRAILRLLAERGGLSLPEIASRWSISAATVRRDATFLANAGLARRTHGGILPPDFSFSEPSYSHKAKKSSDVKARLAQAAAARLPDTGTLFIDAGSTCLEVGRALLDRPKLRLFTNSVPLLALAGDARATLTAIGGEVRGVSLAMTGAFAVSWMESLRFDVAVMGASGLEAAGGASTTEIAEAGVKTEALRRARQRMLIADADKWNRPAGVRFSPWSAFHHFITNRNLTRAERAWLVSAGVSITTVSTK